MVILVNNVPISDSPRSLNWLYHQYPSLKEAAKQLAAAEPKQLAGAGTLYVAVREYAVTQATDSKVSVVGTDNLTNNTAIILRNPGTGSLALGHVDRLTDDDLAGIISKLTAGGGGGCSPTSTTSPAAPTTPKLQLHLIGGFADTKNVSESLLAPVLATLHRSAVSLELLTCCIGEAATVSRAGGAPWPAVHGVAAVVKTGTLFPVAGFLDRGPDMDIRLARTLAGGEGVGMLDIYSAEREELRVGPFSYLPMRSVDIWLNQSDDFILQSLTPCPEVVADREDFVRQVRATLRVVKSHPYPSVTLFQSNAARTYRKDEVSGGWVPTSTSAFWSLPFTSSMQCHTKPEPQVPFQDDLCLNFKQESFLSWQGFQEPQVYY